MGKVVADVTSVGRLFHKQLPATGKARSPTVTSPVIGTTRALDVEESSRCRFSSATCCRQCLSMALKEKCGLFHNTFDHPIKGH